jgi:hypothetical protein
VRGRHVETKLRRDGEPYVVGAQNEMQILLECADDAVDKAVAVGHYGAGREAPPEGRVQKGLVGP